MESRVKSRLMPSFAVAVWFVLSRLADTATFGVLDCPCLSSASPLLPQIQAQLLAASISASYGTEGCKAYDKGQAAFGCSTNAQSYCLNEWCYVDMDKCAVDKAKCEAAGGVLGSEVSPYCRSRASHASIYVNITQFSYETCGFMDTYSTDARTAEVAGRHIRVATSAWAPWIVTKKNPVGKEEFGGALYDFTTTVFEIFEPKPTIVDKGWATPASRAKFPDSSYTACVHDVAIGNFDMCIADLWRTPARVQMSLFTPALRQDMFYLIVPAQEEETTVWTLLEKPFAPFTPDAWKLLVAFILLMALFLHLMKTWHHRDHLKFMGTKACIIWNLRGFINSFLSLWHNFLAGSGHHEPSKHVEERRAFKFFQIAWAFFLLVILASYTASLASLLVVKSAATGSIADINAAIEKGERICGPQSLQGPLEELFPTASFVYVESDILHTIPRLIYSGKCGVAINTMDFLATMHAGEYKQMDCDAVKNGDLSEDEAHCNKGFKDRERSDCDLIRTGEILFTYPIAFPIHPDLVHGMSWAITMALANGEFEKAKKSNSDGFPKSKCEVSTIDDEVEGLGIADLSGTFIVAISFFVVGLLLFIIQICAHGVSKIAGRRLTPEWLEKADATEDSRDSRTMDALTTISMRLERMEERVSQSDRNVKEGEGSLMVSMPEPIKSSLTTEDVQIDIENGREDVQQQLKTMLRAKAESDAAFMAKLESALHVTMAPQVITSETTSEYFDSLNVDIDPPMTPPLSEQKQQRQHTTENGESAMWKPSPSTEYLWQLRKVRSRAAFHVASPDDSSSRRSPSMAYRDTLSEEVLQMEQDSLGNKSKFHIQS